MKGKKHMKVSKLTVTGLVVGGVVGVGSLLITGDIGLLLVIFLTINILVQTVRICQGNVE